MEAPPPAPPPPAAPAAPCSAARSLQDELTCPVCLEYFSDPVLVTECGHNFCRACVTQCWEDSARRLCCPQCREPVPQRLFRPNRSLGNIVHIVRQLGLPLAPAEAPPPPLPGPAPAPAEGPPRCPRHGEPLRLFCVQDRRAVCLVCQLSREHRGHTVLPAEEAPAGAEVSGGGRGGVGGGGGDPPSAGTHQHTHPRPGRALGTSPRTGKLFLLPSPPSSAFLFPLPLPPSSSSSSSFFLSLPIPLPPHFLFPKTPQEHDTKLVLTGKFPPLPLPTGAAAGAAAGAAQLPEEEPGGRKGRAGAAE